MIKAFMNSHKFRKKPTKLPRNGREASSSSVSLAPNCKPSSSLFRMWDLLATRDGRTALFISSVPPLDARPLPPLSHSHILLDRTSPRTMHPSLGRQIARLLSHRTTERRCAIRCKISVVVVDQPSSPRYQPTVSRRRFRLGKFPPIGSEWRPHY